MWASQVDALIASGYRIVAFDLRGHGASTAMPGPYTMAMLADDIHASLMEMGIDRFHLVGLSIGGMIAQAFAIGRPESLLSLTLSSTLPRSADNAADIWRPRIELVLQQQGVGALTPSTIERWLSPAFRHQYPETSQAIVDGIGKTSVAGFLGCVAAMQDFDFTGSLPKLAVPTLVLCGSADSSASPAANKRIASLIPKARYVEIPDAMHLLNVEKPGEFNNQLIAWLHQADCL
jgi:3-oxoadipate enol-lactonase